MANILCIDIGNTNAHYGVFNGVRFIASGSLPTTLLTQSEDEFKSLLKTLSTENKIAIHGISFCSVVPAATEAFTPRAAASGLRVHHLRHDACPGLDIHYPHPEEIGQDRLANCIGAQEISGAPAVIIDMGTAVTFDVLTAKGYEGGIIAPGFAIMTRYLHEQTALLPALDPEDLLDPNYACPPRLQRAPASTGIGKSTTEAMKLGCAVGFSGMIWALLETVLRQLTAWGGQHPRILATGGTSGILLPRDWKAEIRWEPKLTLLGLAVAFRRSNP